MMFRARFVRGLAVLLMTLGAAHAQSYPAKPIRLLLPFAGGTDVVGRLIALKLSPALGQQVVPDPRLGAGGNIAHEAVAKAAPDGYTLLMAAPPVLINPLLNPKVALRPAARFRTGRAVGSIPNVLVVHPSVPAKISRDLTQLARARPGKLTYGSGGVGSVNQLAAELMKSLTKTDIVHVPYKSATIALVGAMSGEVDVVIVAVSSVVAYAKEGRMRALAILDSKRVGSLPQVPTTAEAGLPQLVAVNWYMLLAPAGDAARHRRSPQRRVGQGHARARHARAPRGDGRRTCRGHARADGRVPAHGIRALGQGDPRRRHQERVRSKA